MLTASLIQFKSLIKEFCLSVFFYSFAAENKEAYTSATCTTFRKGKRMKKFLFSMALALGTMCMPSQASAAKVASPSVNNIKSTATFKAARTKGPVIIITKDGTVVIIA